MVDRLEGTKQAELREDDIDFDYQSFKQVCIGQGNLAKDKNYPTTQGWNNKDCQRHLRQLKRQAHNKYAHYPTIQHKKIKGFTFFPKEPAQLSVEELLRLKQ